MVSSTWGPHALLGERFELVRGLLADLPVDEYKVVLAPHPNVWHGHGPWQLRAWLADCERAGLVLLPAQEGWRAALVAGDALIGDHGSVTCYGAALGLPVLLGAFPFEDLDPCSPVAALGRAAPPLRADRPLADQVEAAISAHDPDRYAAVTAAVTSARGESTTLLRGVIYQRMGLTEPARRVVVSAVPVPELPRAVRRGPTAWWVETDLRKVTAQDAEGAMTVTFAVTRRPAELAEPAAHAHLAVDESTPRTSVLPLADVVVRRADDLAGTPAQDVADLLIRYPGCSVAAAAAESGVVVLALRTSSGIRWYQSTEQSDDAGRGPAARRDPLDGVLHASALHGWVARGRPVGPIMTFRLHLGRASHVLVVRRDDDEMDGSV